LKYSHLFSKSKPKCGFLIYFQPRSALLLVCFSFILASNWLSISSQLAPFLVRLFSRFLRFALRHLSSADSNIRLDIYVYNPNSSNHLFINLNLINAPQTSSCQHQSLLQSAHQALLHSSFPCELFSLVLPVQVYILQTQVHRVPEAAFLI
jgi:hypothetical protein